MKIKTNRFAVAAAVLLALCLVFVAPVVATEPVTTSDAFKEAVTANDKNIVVTLGVDVSYDISAWGNYPLGGEGTETITINGNYHTLTFNQLNSDWNNVHTNGATLILNNVKITNNGHNNGPWNRHDINFNCSVVLTNVYSDKALAFKKGATLTNVTINDPNTSDTYAIWIQPNGQTVTINELTIDMIECSDGRGIKIDEQYVDNPVKVTLSITDATFKTEEKSAIIVKSKAGADITLSGNIDISNVVEDKDFAVWIDEGSAAYANLVTVTGGSVKVEGVNPVAKIDNVYYGTLAEAVAAANAGDTVTLLTDVELDSTLTIDKSITIDLGGKTIYGTEAAYRPVKITGLVEVIVKNGVINTTDVTAPSGKTVAALLVYDYADVIVEDLTIESNDFGIIVAGLYSAGSNDDKTKLIVRDNCVFTTDGTAISGNGQYEDTYIEINDGAVITGSFGIYHPQVGELVINGGTITGQNAVYFKSGSLTITDGELVGNGEKADYGYVISGCNPTGDALVIENVGGTTGYEAISSVSISGGTFTSANAAAVASYAATEANSEAVPVTAFITGGTFSSNPSAYIAPGMEVVQPGDKYLVQKYVDRSSSSSSSKPVEEPEEPEQPEEPVVEPETPAAPGEATVETEVTDGGEVELETPAAEGEGGSAAADEDEAKITGVVLPTGTDSEVTFVPVSEQPAPAGQEENTKKVFEINVPTYEKGKPAVIKFQMTVEELAADGKEAADVALWHFDEETGEWTKLVTSYTIVDGVVYFEAITEDFSPFAIVYEDEPADEPVEEPETPASPAPVLGLLAALGAAVVLRRK